MPRFYFDINDGAIDIRDDLGTEFVDRDAARLAAIDALPDIARDVMPNGNHRIMTCHVRDDQGRIIFEAKLILDARWLSDIPEN
ncbi:DUF6894 family protein [Lichenihabitans psoromatis]|uniref:DUF6894 family protein n=1 Tax=Lichenihabitans psoromatis TaxID=2528642 RepID=UPI003CCA81EF